MDIFTLAYLLVNQPCSCPPGPAARSPLSLSLSLPSLLSFLRLTRTQSVTCGAVLRACERSGGGAARATAAGWSLRGRAEEAQAERDAKEQA
eukprot:1166557-Rhodomonas_salina.1